jgi:hypothetical protein
VNWLGPASDCTATVDNYGADAALAITRRRQLVLGMGGGEHVSDARLLVRFGVGATELGGERLIAALRALDASLADNRSHAADALRLRHALLGALFALPEAGRAALARAQTVAQPLRAKVTRGQRMVARLPGAGWAGRRYDEIVARVEAQLMRWAVAGRDEERAGHALAATAIRRASEALVSAFADSPELARVVAEQSESLGAHAMTELREGSVRADALVERAARRLLRRSR